MSPSLCVVCSAAQGAQDVATAATPSGLLKSQSRRASVSILQGVGAPYLDGDSQRHISNGAEWWVQSPLGQMLLRDFLGNLLERENREENLFLPSPNKPEPLNQRLPSPLVGGQPLQLSLLSLLPCGSRGAYCLGLSKDTSFLYHETG